MATIDKALSALRKEKEMKNKTLLSLLSSNPPSRPSALMRNHVSSLLEKIISTEKEQDKNNTRRKRSYGLQQFPRKGGWGMVIAKNTITWRLVSFALCFYFCLSLTNKFIMHNIIMNFKA